jgi:hypothetical protein
MLPKSFDLISFWYSGDRQMHNFHPAVKAAAVVDVSSAD